MLNISVLELSVHGILLHEFTYLLAERYLDLLLYSFLFCSLFLRVQGWESDASSAVAFLPHQDSPSPVIPLDSHRLWEPLCMGPWQFDPYPVIPQHRSVPGVERKHRALATQFGRIASSLNSQTWSHLPKRPLWSQAPHQVNLIWLHRPFYLQFTTRYSQFEFLTKMRGCFNEDFHISITWCYGHRSQFGHHLNCEENNTTLLFLAQALANPTPTAKRCKPGWKSPTLLRSYKRRRDIQRPHFKQVIVRKFIFKQLWPST